MDTKKHNILVLSDLKATSENLIESTVNLAKKINGDIEFFILKSHQILLRMKIK